MTAAAATLTTQNGKRDAFTERERETSSLLQGLKWALPSILACISICMCVYIYIYIYICNSEARVQSWIVSASKKSSPLTSPKSIPGVCCRNTHPCADGWSVCFCSGCRAVLAAAFGNKPPFRDMWLLLRELKPPQTLSSMNPWPESLDLWCRAPS